MPELKVICNCGQKYKFDVEPVNGRMPFAVTCPVCGIDGTHHANAMLNQLSPPSLAAMPAIGSASVASAETAAPMTSAAMPAPPAPAPSVGGSKLSINRPPRAAPRTAADSRRNFDSAVATASASDGAPPSPVNASVAVPKYMQDNAAIQNNSFLLGVVGALGGTVVGVGLVVAFALMTDMKLPLTGTLIGALTGFGARLGYRGTDSTLGGMAAAVAFLSIAVTMFLLFGVAGLLFSVITLFVSVSMAFKIASG